MTENREDRPLPPQHPAPVPPLPRLFSEADACAVEGAFDGAGVDKGATGAYSPAMARPTDAQPLVGRILRVVVGLTLSAAGALKLCSGDTADSLTVGLGIAESFFGLALVIGRLVRCGLAFALLIAIGGSLQALVTKAPCRCLGSYVQIEWRAHVAICCILGILVAVGLMSSASQKNAR